MQGCLEHSNSEVLAYFISFLPKRFDLNLALKFDPTQQKIHLRTFTLILKARRPDLILTRLELDGNYCINKKQDQISSEFLLKRVRHLYLRNVQIQVLEEPFCVLGNESYLTELRIGSGTSCVVTES